MLVLDALSLQVPLLSEEHVNRAPFTGILTRIDEPSTRPPNGSDGHLVLMPYAAAEKALPSLLGMGVNTADNLRGHAKQAKIGVITAASIDGQDLVISGHLYEKDFPDEVEAIRAEKDRLGMSYELSNVEVDDPQSMIWVLTSFIFTGAAILYKESAAYQQTAIAAQAEHLVEESVMSQKILDELAKIQQQLDAMQASTTTDAADETEAAETTEATAETEAAEADAAKCKADEEAAAKCKADEDAASTMKAMAKLMKAMGYKDDEEDAAEDQDAMMKHMFRAMLKSMSYPGGFATEHDDEAEDIALFKRLMRQGRMDAGSAKKKAENMSPELLALQKQMKELSAAMGLITDTLKRQTGLITDLAKGAQGLVTDSNHGNNGGAVRKTMAATGEAWAGKFDGAEMDAASQDLQKKMAELEAQLDKEKVLDPRDRIARKLDLSWNSAATSRN